MEVRRAARAGNGSPRSAVAWRLTSSGDRRPIWSRSNRRPSAIGSRARDAGSSSRAATTGERHVARSMGQVVEHGERRLVGPVDVVHDEQSGTADQQVEHGLDEAGGVETGPVGWRHRRIRRHDSAPHDGQSTIGFGGLAAPAGVTTATPASPVDQAGAPPAAAGTARFARTRSSFPTACAARRPLHDRRPPGGVASCRSPPRRSPARMRTGRPTRRRSPGSSRSTWRSRPNSWLPESPTPQR